MKHLKRINEIIEGPEKTNTKNVISQRPNVMPAPQPKINNTFEEDDFSNFFKDINVLDDKELRDKYNYEYVIFPGGGTLTLKGKKRELTKDEINIIRDFHNKDKHKAFNDKVSQLVQEYIGMTPKDKGCENWSEMQDKMTNDIIKLIKNK